MAIRLGSIDFLFQADTPEEIDRVVDRIVSAVNIQEDDDLVEVSKHLNGTVAKISVQVSEKNLNLLDEFFYPETLRGEKDEVPDPDWEQRDSSSWDRLVD